MTNIALGTSSWLFDAWRGVFYPDGMAQREYLPFYARNLATVEVNTTFYASPRMTTIARWVDAVPPGFTFCCKFPRAITHDKRLVDCEAETLEFLARLRQLGPYAAPAFLQFPPSFTRQQFGRQLAAYLDWLAPQVTDLRIAVEVRAQDLMTPAFAAFLAARGLGLVLVDRVATPDMTAAWVESLTDEAAPTFAVVRWIGDDENGPKGDRDLSAPRNADLDRWAVRLVDFARHGIDVFGYMHNPYEGHAPASVRRLEARLRALLPVTPWAPAANPLPDAEDGQLSLFD